MKERESFEFPSNVKQIGSIDDEIKVYVEDYAYTYICQYSRAESCSEKVAALVGEYIEAEGKKVVLISGLIQGKYSDGGGQLFTDETWEYIKTRKERYFKDFEIVGWLHSQSGNGISISEDEKKLHEECFIEPYQVVFIMDSAEHIDTFFVWDKGQEYLRELKGYFIYYDKNDSMQEYMLDNKLVKSRGYDYKENDETIEKEDIIINYRRHDKLRRDEVHQKKVLNMLVGTSGVVVVLCFLMGMLLVQNSERMNRLEAELVNVNDGYRELTKKPISTDDGTAVVFASQDKAIPETQSEPSKEEEINAMVTVAPTQPATVAPTQPVTVAPTQPVTVAPTQPATVAPTQPATVAPTQPATEEATHIVAEGDSLSWISKHYYGTNKMINKIMEYNDIKDPDKVYIGMIIKLPKE